MNENIPYQEALDNYKAVADRLLPEINYDDLLENYHPDYFQDACVKLKVGTNKGDICHAQLADMLQADARIDEADLAGAQVIETDLLVIGGGGAGCAAALTAVESGAKVILATKLRLGDSNTIMAEGGVQVSIEKGDTPQQHLKILFEVGTDR